MVKFQKYTKAELKQMSLEEVEEYYKQLRKYNHENDVPIKGIVRRKAFNKLLIPMLKLNRIKSKQKMTIINDSRMKTKKPKIYAVTHVGRYDIEMSMEAIKDSNYLLMGDPGEVYRNAEGKLLSAKGVVFVDTNDSEDKKIAEATCTKILKKGGNILMFPEGAWNITENEVVMKLYNGAVRMAKETDAEIIPVAIEWYGEHYFINIGKNIDVSNQKEIENRKLSDDLRGIMGCLRWNIWEKQGITERSTIPDTYAEEYINTIMADTENGYTIEEIERTRYKDKDVTSPEEVFGPRKKETSSSGKTLKKVI